MFHEGDFTEESIAAIREGIPGGLGTLVEFRQVDAGDFCAPVSATAEIVDVNRIIVPDARSLSYCSMCRRWIRHAAKHLALSENDARRRIVHYHYKFGLVEKVTGTLLALKSVYLYQSISLPPHELNEFHDRVVMALKEGGWTEDGDDRWTRDDLLRTVRQQVRHPRTASPAVSCRTATRVST